MQFDQINVFVDSVIFSLINNKIHVLLGKRRKEPFVDKYSLVGGHHKKEYNTDGSMKFHLKEKLNLNPRNLEKFNWSSEPNQDPRGPSISLAYLILFNEQDRKNLNFSKDHFHDVEWFPLDEIDLIPFGFSHHKNIIQDAFSRLETKVRYTKAGFELLNKEFTIYDVVNGFQSIISKKIDPSNLKKKLLKLKLLDKVSNSDKKQRRGPKTALYSINKKSFSELKTTTCFFKKD